MKERYRVDPKDYIYNRQSKTIRIQQTPKQKVQTISLPNPFIRQSPFKSLKNSKTPKKQFTTRHNERTMQNQKQNGRYGCSSFQSLNSYSSIVSISSIPDTWSLSSHKNRFEKEFSIQKKRIQLFGPEIIRYKINESSVVKEYFNEKIETKKEKRKSRNQYAAQQYFFVQGNKEVQHKLPQQYSQYEENCQNNQSKILKIKPKRQLSIKKSLSWQEDIAQIENDTPVFPTFRHPSYQQSSFKSNNKASKFQNQRKIMEDLEKYQNFDEIIEKASSDQTSLIQFGNNKLNYFNSSQMSKLSNFRTNKQSSDKQSWGISPLNSYQSSSSNQNSQFGLSRFRKKSNSKFKLAPDGKKKKKIPSTIFYDQKNYHHIRI